MHDIAIILPAFNEELTIGDTIEDFYIELPNAHFVVVDNGSTDGTNLAARSAISRLGLSGEVFLELRRGKAMAVRTAFSLVDAQIYVLVDADLTYPASDVHSLISPILDGNADMVVGDRISTGAYKRENSRSFHSLGNAFVRKLINSLFNSNLHDILSGYRALTRKFVKGYPILVRGFELETDLTVHALDKRFRIIEVDVNYRDRPRDSFSKLNTYSDGFRVIKMVVNIFRYYRPLAFFGWLGFTSAIFSIVSAIKPISDWLETRYVEHVPLALLSVGFGLTSALCFVCGLVLDALARQNRFNYEISLNIDVR